MEKKKEDAEKMEEVRNPDRGFVEEPDVELDDQPEDGAPEAEEE